MNKPNGKTPRRMSAFSVLCTFVAYFGGFVLNTLYIIFHSLGKGIGLFFRFVWRLTNNIRRRAFALLCRIGSRLAAPFKKAAKSFKIIFREIKRANNRHGLGKATGVALKNLGKLLFYITFIN